MSRRRQVIDCFLKEGKEAAIAFGVSLGIKEITARTYITDYQAALKKIGGSTPLPDKPKAAKGRVVMLNGDKASTLYGYVISESAVFVEVQWDQGWKQIVPRGWVRQLVQLQTRS